MTELDALRTKLAFKKPTLAKWQQPVLSDFADGSVIGIDQSFTATGIVALQKFEEVVSVVQVWTVRTPINPQVGGHESNLRRTLELTRAVQRTLGSFLGQARWCPGQWTVVHEAPPTGGGHLWRPEVSLLAAAAVRMALASSGVVLAPMVQAQDHHYLLTGNHHATKVEAHQCMMDWASLLPINDLTLITNEAKRDALAIALYQLWRKKKLSEKLSHES